MVRYIRPGNDALIKALSSAGVPLNLGAHPTFDSTNALDVTLFGFDAGVNSGRQLTALNASPNFALHVAPIGSRGAVFLQSSVGNALDVELQTGGQLYDARSIRQLATTDIITAAGSTGVALSQDANNKLRVGLATTAGADYDARDTSDRAAREVGRVRDWGATPTSTSNGEITAPGANAIIANSGNIAAGTYNIVFTAFAADTSAVGKKIALIRRNAGDTADQEVYGGCAAPGQIYQYIPRVAIALNERLLARTGAVAAAGSIYSANVRWWVAG